MEDLQFQLEEEVLSKEDIMVGTTSCSPNLFSLFYGLCLLLLFAVISDQFITVQCGILFTEACYTACLCRFYRLSLPVQCSFCFLFMISVVIHCARSNANCHI